MGKGLTHPSGLRGLKQSNLATVNTLYMYLNTFQCQIVSIAVTGFKILYFQFRLSIENIYSRDFILNCYGFDLKPPVIFTQSQSQSQNILLLRIQKTSTLEFIAIKKIYHKLVIYIYKYTKISTHFQYIRNMAYVYSQHNIFRIEKYRLKCISVLQKRVIDKSSDTH